MKDINNISSGYNTIYKCQGGVEVHGSQRSDTGYLKKKIFSTDEHTDTGINTVQLSNHNSRYEAFKHQQHK